MARGGTKKTDLPAAIEAEQALLGALLFENSAFANLPPMFGAEHFSEPFHARLFVRMKLALEKGQPMDAVILGSAFHGDPAFEELGGISYMVDLIDRAPPGENAPSYAKELISTHVRRELVLLANEMETRAWDASEDPLTTLSAASTAMTSLYAADDEIRLVSADEALDDVLDYIDNPAAHGTGITTGLAPLDDALGPWMDGDLIVLGARPSMGKSAIAAIIGQNVAVRPDPANGVQGVGVIEIHAEMTVAQAWRRRLTATAFSLYAEQAPAYSAIRKRTVSYDERQMLGKAREMLRGLPLHGVKRTNITLGRLRALVVRQAALWKRQGIKLGLVTIDHVGLIKTERDYASRVDQQTEISGGLKALAGDLKVPILALAQLSRKVEDRDDKRPTISDLRDSGSWEQDADVVLGCYREAYYAQREREPALRGEKGQLEYAEWDRRRNSPWIDIGLLKVREGEVGNARLWANMRTNTILGTAPMDDSFFGGF